MTSKGLWLIPIIAGLICLAEYIGLLLTQSFHWFLIVGIIVSVVPTITSCIELLRREKDDK